VKPAGRVLVIVLVLLGAASVVVHRVRSPRSRLPSVGGIIQLYGDGTIVIETTAAIREVRVDGRTIVRDVDSAASLADLRPGRYAVAWIEQDTWRGPPVAREIVVFGAGR
jgi:hypothetical protein